MADKKLIIEDLSVKKKVPKRIRDLNPLLQKPPFKMILLGSSGSGKTNFLRNLFKKNFYGGGKSGVFKSNNIIVISPSADVDPEIGLIPADNFFTEFDEKIIDGVVEQQTAIIRTKGKNKLDNVLIIAEDCLDTGMFNRGGFIEKISYRIRHFNVSFIISCQKLSALPRGLRLNTECIILFQQYNMSEFDHLADEVVKKDDRKKFMNMIKYVLSKPYNFLYIENKLNSKNPSKYREGLDRFIQLDDFENYKKNEELLTIQRDSYDSKTTTKYGKRNN